MVQKLNSILNNKHRDHIGGFFIVFFIFLGGVVRFYPVLINDFPLIDGGMFFQMTRDILAHNFSLPLYTTYNGNVIPFVYPPLAFFLMATLEHFFNFSLVDQLHYIPAVFSTAAIPTIYFLSKRVTSSKTISTFAVLGFALMPGSYVWLIMGGGISRALGTLFAIISLNFIWEMFKIPKVSNLLLSIVFSSLTILSHPTIAWFLFISAILIGLLYGLNKKGVLFGLSTLAGILLITSPWWVVILQRFGFSPFVNASPASGMFDPFVILFYFSAEPLATIFAVIAMIGMFAEIANRRYFISLWLLVTAIFTLRFGQLFATIPASLLFGSGMVLIIIPGLLKDKSFGHEEEQDLGMIFRARIVKISFSIILALGLISAMAVPFIGDIKLKALSSYDRQAMEWVAQNPPADSEFAVLTGKNWTTDYVSEWFPALAERNSITTVQGTEWLPNQQYKKTIDAYSQLQSCANKGYSCVSAWAGENGINNSYLYISKLQTYGEEAFLPITYFPVPEEGYRLVYENPEVEIYQVISQP
jgi:hypothetical protein